MGEDRVFSRGARSLVIAAAFVIVVAGMRAAQPIVVPFLLSMFLAIISAPALFWLRQKGIPTVFALLIVIAGIMGIGFLMGLLIGASLNRFSADLPFFQARLQEQLRTDTQRLVGWLTSLGFEVSEETLLEYFDPSAIIRLVAGTLSRLRGLLTNAFLILLTVSFILLEASSIPTKLQAIWAGRTQSFTNLDKIVDDVKRYMVRKTAISLATGIAIAVWFAILGIYYPLLWGLLAFLLNFVPNIGSLIAAIPAILFAFLQLGLKSALLATLGFVIVNLVIGNIIEPRYMGRSMGLSTLVVFISLVFWGWVLGPIGMLLSVPLTMAVKIALEDNEDTRWIAILLGSEASVRAASRAQSGLDESRPGKGHGTRE